MRVLSPRLLLGVASVVTLFILFSLAQEMNRRLQVRQEILGLEQEVRELETSVVEMENLNQYFRTEAFQERMAREKLNYRAPGEEVVLIAENVLGVTDEVEATLSEETRSIPARWWDAFFVEPLEAIK